MPEIVTPEAPQESPAMQAAREMFAEKPETTTEPEVQEPAKEVAKEPAKEPEIDLDAEIAKAKTQSVRTAGKFDIMARAKARDLAEIETKRKEFDTRLAQARPVLDILESLGPDAAKVIEAAKSIASAKGKDPAAILAAHGFSDPMQAAETIVGRSMGEKAPPAMLVKMTEAALRAELAAEREARAALEKRIDGWEKKQERSGLMAEYKTKLAGVVEGLSFDDYPAIKAYGPQALEVLASIQERNHEQHGQYIPDQELLEEYENALAKELPPAFIEWAKQQRSSPPGDSQPGTKKQAVNAGEKQAAKTLAGVRTTSRPQKVPETDEEIAEAAAKHLAELRQKRAARRI